MGGDAEIRRMERSELNRRIVCNADATGYNRRKLTAEDCLKSAIKILQERFDAADVDGRKRKPQTLHATIERLKTLQQELVK